MRTVLTTLLLGMAAAQLPYPPVKQRYTGGIQGYLNSQSLDDTLDHFSKIIPEFLKRESQFSLDMDLVNGLFWDLHVYGMKLSKLEIDKRSIKMVPGDKYPKMVFEI